MCVTLLKLPLRKGAGLNLVCTNFSIVLAFNFGVFFYNLCSLKLLLNKLLPHSKENRVLVFMNTYNLCDSVKVRGEQKTNRKPKNRKPNRNPKPKKTRKPNRKPKNQMVRFRLWMKNRPKITEPNRKWRFVQKPNRNRTEPNQKLLYYFIFFKYIYIYIYI